MGKLTPDLFGRLGDLSSSLGKDKQVIFDPIRTVGVEITPDTRPSFVPGPPERDRFDPPLPTALETWWRHGLWAARRALVRSAMVDAGVPWRRVFRFDSCGASAVVEMAEDAITCRVRGFFCGDRFCEPCGKARSARVRHQVIGLADQRELRFVTFARRGFDIPMVEAKQNLMSGFKKMRSDPEWKEFVDGGAGVMEIKRGKLAGLWHPHFHCLLTGRRYEQAALSDCWLRATGDSDNVHISYIYDYEQGAGYVCKYASKGFHPSVVENHDDLVECIRGLRGARLLVTFGDWFGRLDDVAPKPQRRWVVIGGLERLILAADQGDAYASEILRSIPRGNWAVAEREPLPATDGGQSVTDGPYRMPTCTADRA